MDKPNQLTFWWNATLNSYSQLFFSKNKGLGLLLLIVSFLDPSFGISGLLAISTCSIIALLMGFDRQYVEDGNYGFNGLLVGLGLATYFEPGIPFFALLIVASLMVFMLTASLTGALSRYNLPSLSFPFILTLWCVLLASRYFESIGISPRKFFLLDKFLENNNIKVVGLYNNFNELFIPNYLGIYFKSLGSILFQPNILSGAIITLGLLFTSRIIFTLSLFGFFSAYFFCLIIGVNFAELSYSAIGFNFILTGIAIGAFFLIPSWRSFLWIVILVPPMVILTAALGNLFGIVLLNAYSLPFTILTITFLYVLKQRYYSRGPEETPIQLYQPEKNLYEKLSNNKRYHNYRRTGINLPVYGDWLVTQGPDGKITHKGDWADAWDFAIVDEQHKEYKNYGTKVEDYYCYNKPIIAPSNGIVEAIIDNIEDNRVGSANLFDNWGNSIVIKHSDNLYSQVSHLKRGSIKVYVGEYVRMGQVLAACGNSGRSPTPHVHFQIQEMPFVGSKTLKYPLSHFVVKEGKSLAFNNFDYPKEGELVRSIRGNEFLKNIFHFIPGKSITYQIKINDQQPYEVVWEVKRDKDNRVYIYCKKSKSKAYFNNDGTLFQFTFFDGDKNSELYYFFLGGYKILLNNDHDIKTEDFYPLYIFSNPIRRWFHDFVAPFYQYMESKFILNYLELDNDLSPEQVVIGSSSKSLSWGKTIKKIDYEFKIRNNGINEFTVWTKNSKIHV